MVQKSKLYRKDNQKRLISFYSSPLRTLTLWLFKKIIIPGTLFVIEIDNIL